MSSSRCTAYFFAPFLCAITACLAQIHVPKTPAKEDFQHKDPVDAAELASLASLAEAAPQNPHAQFKAGMGYIQATLVGHLQYQERAERFLLRSHQLQANAYGSARILGRFLNMRNSVLDSSKSALQIELYSSLLTDSKLDEAPQDEHQFHLHSFLHADRAFQHATKKQWLAALRQIHTLEAELLTRAEQFPDEIDSFTMAGTFESTFAGAIPVGRHRRARRAIASFSVQQARWHEQSPGARDQDWAPNTRSVFLFAWAECLLFEKQVDAAKMIYQRLLDQENEPQTTARDQLLTLARHRIEFALSYAGQEELMPPWPSGVTGCVGCHARQTKLPADDLYLLPGVRKDQFFSTL